MIAALSVAAASCTSSVPDSTVTVTAIAIDLRLSWSPPETLTSEDRSLVVDTLTAAGRSLLLPSLAPPTVETTHADLTVTRTLPTSLTAALVVVYNGDDVVLAVQSFDASSSSSCNQLIEGDGDSPWVVTEVRERYACSTAPANAVALLQWEERRQRFRAESSALSVDEIAAWLSSWKIAPDPVD